MPVRKRRLSPAEMDAAQRALYTEIAQGPRARESAFRLVDDDGALEGPFDALLLQPAIGAPVQAVGSALRFGGRLPARARETAILIVAHFRASAFEVRAHEAVGARVGLSSADLEALSRREPPVEASPTEVAVTRVALRLLEHGDLDDAEYEHAVAILGEAVLFEVATIVGYYSLLATQLKLFGHDG